MSAAVSTPCSLLVLGQVGGNGSGGWWAFGAALKGVEGAARGLGAA